MSLTIDFLNVISHQNPIINQYREYLFKKLNPNITGFNLIFMVPPHLSGIEAGNNFINNFANQNNLGNQNLNALQMYLETVPFLTFAASDYSMPTTQVVQGQINPRTGGAPYISDVISSEACNITYVDNNQCVVYLYHLLWLEYIRAIVGGGYFDQTTGNWIAIKPNNQYIDESNPNYGTLDYACSIYVVKYMPNMNDITYIGKAIGCVPVNLPSKELLGTKSVNDLALLPFDYVSGLYREYVANNNTNYWLYDEVRRLILSRYDDTDFRERIHRGHVRGPVIRHQFRGPVNRNQIRTQ